MRTKEELEKEWWTSPPGNLEVLLQGQMLEVLLDIRELLDK